MSKPLYCLTISRSSLSFKAKLGLILRLLWTPTGESVSSAMGASTHWMRAAWQLSLSSSKLSMTLLRDISRRGSHPQCSFSKILCFDCGKVPGVLRKSSHGIGFVVCDPCFKHWTFYSWPDGGRWVVYLVNPYRSLVMSSSSLNDAVECMIDLSGLNVDNTWSKSWKKARLKKLLRVGERNF